MTGRSSEFIAAIERPLRYIQTGDTKRLSSVKNLSKHILEVSRQALGTGLPEDQTHLFHSLQDLFTGYDTLSDTEKQTRVAQALELIHPEAKPRRPVAFRPEEHPSVSLARVQECQGRLSKRVQYLKGVGPSIAAKFEKAGIFSVDDLLMLFPNRYEDRRVISTIGALKEGAQNIVVGTIAFSGVVFYRGLRRRVFEVLLEDESGSLKLKWFQFYLGTFEGVFKRGQKVIVCGKPKRYRNQMEMYHPDFEVFGGTVDSMSFGRIVPIYREVGGVYQKTIRKIMYQAVIEFAGDRICVLPPSICRQHDLLPPSRALRELHQPSTVPPLEVRTDPLKALAFEELFLYCLSLGLRKKLLKGRPGIVFSKESLLLGRLLQKLPFELTAAQKSVFETIRKDMASPHPMNRLLQGDVGSGKTIVAFMAALVAIDHGYQVAFMAPTEILAEQHRQTLMPFAAALGIRIDLLLGRTPAAEKAAVQARVQSGATNLIIGTHALLESGVKFQSVGLVVVDEQHRFGVRQRATIRSKGVEPDVLVMSATPIPRTLALTLYGDLDVSILNQLPKGRKPIDTKLFLERDRKKVYELVSAEVRQGRQAYIVYPLVDPSDKVELKDATTMAKTLQKDIFPSYRVALVHGQMPGPEKERVMEAFRKNEVGILVSTTVIEVGIDVPNATLMVIEHPERFGLSQLHQLRGRVGRGTERSFCHLIRPPRVTEAARERLEIFSRIHDGFLLAEEDLRLRGPGDFFGVEQSGFPTFAVAVFPRDLDLLETARREALSFLEADADLRKRENEPLRWYLEAVWKDRLNLVRVG